jgi:molybdopterin-guanine dinucleotide biosynthesis protein A
MELPNLVAGVVLAGGKSSRMGGGDKCLAPLGRKPLLAYVVERLKPQVAALAINANDDPARFAGFGLPVIADSIAGSAGPLAGILAGLEWAESLVPHVRYVVTVASDTPFLPNDLVARFLAALAETGRTSCVARSAGGVHPVIGLWPVALAAELKETLDRGLRKASAWAEQQGAVEVFFPPAEIGGTPVDPFFNINRPEDLAAAEELINQQALAKG